MDDPALVEFLQWALPRMGLRWAGFRKVRRQLRKRLGRRLRTLGLPHLAAYREYLHTHDEEWRELDRLCRITISRFGRDRQVFELLGSTVLPRLAAAAAARGDERVEAWSAGCASGEEPYSLALLWHYRVAPHFPTIRLGVLATDADPELLGRARRATYPAGTLKELPAAWVAEAFEEHGEQYKLRAGYAEGVCLRQQDIRRTLPDGPFDIVLCRNLVLTYFDEALQREIIRRVNRRLRPTGFLVVGSHERLPDDLTEWRAWRGSVPILRKR